MAPEGLREGPGPTAAQVCMDKLATVLLVEDDDDVVATIEDVFRGTGMVLERVATLADAQLRVRSRMHDAVILDLGLPDGGGLALADVLRGVDEEVPILILTAQAGVAQRLEGFARGADDYVCKPFVPEELVARLRALLRRSRSERRHILRYGGVELDLLKRVVTSAGSSTPLSDREVALLAFFMRNAERPISRETLAQEVFGLEPHLDSGVVNVYVNYLRNKLGHGYREPPLIHTVRGIGYMLSEHPPEGP